MTEFRYDGPDLEADTSGRMQGLLMAGVMAADGAHSGRAAAQHRDEQRRLDHASREERADRALWADVPSGDWAELPDAALAQRWQAAARHCGDRDADTARGAIEVELTARDADTMRDYRSWRYGAGADPGTAMQRALTERERRLAASWRPLAEGRGAQLDETQLATGWVAALGAHDPAAQRAAEAGETLLRDRVPALMGEYDIARSATTPTSDGKWAQGQVTGYTAAGVATGHRLAFGPGTPWTATLQHGTPAPAGIPTRAVSGQPRGVPTAASRVLAAHSARPVRRT